MECKTHLLEERPGAAPCVIYILSVSDFRVVAAKRVEGKSETHYAVATTGSRDRNAWGRRNDSQHTVGSAMVLLIPKYISHNKILLNAKLVSLVTKLMHHNA